MSEGEARIGVLGGSFDPPHIGHLAAAEEARWALKLDKVLFAPAGSPPHKIGRMLTAVEHRLAMVRLAVSGNASFVLSLVDAFRPGPNYTVDTLSILRSRYGSGARLFFIVGTDSLLDLATWYQPAEVLRLGELAVVTRPGFREPNWNALEAALPGCRERVHMVTCEGLEVSSSSIRSRVREGRPFRYHVPAAVEGYIRGHGLYTS